MYHIKNIEKNHNFLETKLKIWYLTYHVIFSDLTKALKHIYMNMEMFYP